jgi:hypothetical protein
VTTCNITDGYCHTHGEYLVTCTYDLRAELAEANEEIARCGHLTKEGSEQLAKLLTEPPRVIPKLRDLFKRRK